MMDEKLWREKGKKKKKNFFGMCLVRWKGKKINSEAQMFSLQTH